MENGNPIEIQTPFMSFFTSVLIRVLSGASTTTKASTVSAIQCTLDYTLALVP